MKYRIDIWHSGNIIASHESDDLKELADWYKKTGLTIMSVVFAL